MVAKIVENYRGVDIQSRVLSCGDTLFFVLNKFYTHFPTIEKAREDVDNTIFIEIGRKWVSEYRDYIKGLKFDQSELILIGRNIDNMQTKC